MIKWIKQLPIQAWAIIFGLVAIKLWLAAILPLSNDEVYYHTYALYPALSHFDHPPMVGWIIQLFTCNMQWHNDFFMRLGAIVFSIFNDIIVYCFVRRISNNKAAMVALILFNASFYNSVVAGFFIMPDTGLLTFWLLSLDFFHRCLTAETITKKERQWMIVAGFFTGMAMLSKYQAGSLWVSAFLFVLIFKRKWFKEPVFYLSGFLTLLVFFPAIWWNIQNQFASLSFHGQRVNLLHQKFNYLYFAREFFGQMLYTNFVVYVIIVWSLIYYLKHFSQRTLSEKFFVYFGLPVVFVFLFISIFKSTLPHWSGPGFSTLILLAAITLTNSCKAKPLFLKKTLVWSTSLYVGAVTLIVLQLQFNVIPLGYENDPTTDITGWDELGKKFTQLRTKQLREGKISPRHVFLHYRWFPGAHYDYYLAEPNHINLIVSGDVSNSHKYLWINKDRNGIPKGYDAYYLTADTLERSANQVYASYFKSISEPEPIVIYRNQKPFIHYYLYILHDYNGTPLY
jgi:4-amino-4-deoxy-L-arabinose transferase-like glycosyltransferase